MTHAHWDDPTPGQKDEQVREDAALEAAEDVVFDNGTSGSAKTLSATHKRQKVTLTASGATLTVNGFTNGQYSEITLYLVQDATGSRTLPTFSPAADWGAAGAPTLSTAANAIDVVKLSSINGGTTLDAVLVEKGA